MRLTSLEISGFGAYLQPCQLDFSDVSLAAITGRNGAGKSTLFLATLWALFGDTPDKRSIDDLINPSAQSARVIVEFFDNSGGTHRITRTRQNKKTITKYMKPDGSIENRTRETTRLITETLNCDNEILRSTAFVLSGSAGAFGDATSSQRRSLLSRTLDFSLLDALRIKAKHFAAAKNDAAVVADNDLARQQQLADELTERETAFTIAERTQAEATVRHAELLERAQGKQAPIIELEAAREAAALVRSMRTVIKDLQTKQASIEAKQTELENQKKEYAVTANSLANASRDKADMAARKEAAATAAKQAAVDTEARKQALLNSPSDSQQCWACGAPLDAATRETHLREMDELIARQTNAGIEANHARTEANHAERETNDALTQGEDAAAALEKITNEKAMIETELAVKNEQGKRAYETAKQLPELEAAMREVSDVPTQQQINEAATLRDNASRTVGVYERARDEARTAATSLPSLREAVTQTRKEYRAAELLNTACAPSGMPQLALENALTTITAATNLLLAKLDVAIQVRLSGEGENGGLALQARLAGQNWRDYNTLSTGEQMRLSIALRVAMCQILDVRSDTLIVDEGFGALDPEGITSFIHFLASLINENIVKLVLAVSHIPAVAEKFPHQILVRNETATAQAKFVSF